MAVGEIAIRREPDRTFENPCRDLSTALALYFGAFMALALATSGSLERAVQEQYQGS